MANEISLNASQRDTILSLREVDNLTERTNERLTTGNKVNSVLDDAVAYFLSEQLYGRADVFSGKIDGIDQGISAITTTMDAIDAIDELLDTMKGIAESISTQTDTERASSTEQFIEIGNQISNLIEDAYYNGTNLLNSTNNSLSISFSNRAESQAEINGVDLNADGATVAGLFENTAYDSDLTFIGLSALNAEITSFVGATDDQVTAIETAIDDAIARLNSYASSFSSDVAVLNTRYDFTENYINTLQDGGDKLTLANLDEEAANLTALQTRQELSIQSLGISSDMQRYTINLLTD